MGTRENRKRKLFAQQKAERLEAAKQVETESPFKEGSRRLKKGWKWVNGEPVRVKK